LNSKAKEFAPLSISNSSNVAMLGVYISMIKTLEENLEKVLKAIRSLIIEDMAKDMPMLALTLELLQSIPGIGLISAVTILAEIGDFSAFSKPGKLVAYFGIDPSVMQSGEFTGTQNKMSKRGPHQAGQNSLQPCTDGILQKQMPEQAQESSFGGCYA